MRRRLMIGAIGASVAGAAPAAQWTITPSLGNLQEIFTDNVLAIRRLSWKRADVDYPTHSRADQRVSDSRTLNLRLHLSYNPIDQRLRRDIPGKIVIDQNLVGYRHRVSPYPRHGWTFATIRLFASEEFGERRLLHARRRRPRAAATTAC